MNIAEYITSVLKNNKIEYVFGYQGGNITYMIDAISRSDGISYVQNYQEQGSAYAANAYAQVSGKFGVAVSSSGPGAINMINGIANAYYDSIPCLFITGNINTASMRETEKIRQNGFQEADIVGMVSGITKYARTILDEKVFVEEFHKALQKMIQGRPGPVVLDIPHNIQRMEIGEPKPFLLNRERENIDFSPETEQILNVLQESKRPVLLVGNGCRRKKDRKLVAKLLEKYPMPVVSSLCGKDVVPNEHPCYRGMIGVYGHGFSNRVLIEADTVLVLGSRLDERQRSVGINEFLADAKVIHIDIDENELGHVVTKEMRIHTSVRQFLEYILPKLPVTQNVFDWLEETNTWMKDEKTTTLGKKFYEKMKTVFPRQLDECIICVDVGNHQMAVAQSILVGENSHYLNSAGLGSMGYALPAAIGAYYASQDKPVLCFTGDGGFMMNLQELQLLAREQLPVVILVANNKSLGMIENYQNLAFQGRVYGSRWGYDVPDFEKVAYAFGLEYRTAEQLDDLDWKHINKPMLIEIEVQDEKI